jgi:Family of unknown function (DUF5681)
MDEAPQRIPAAQRFRLSRQARQDGDARDRRAVGYRSPPEHTRWKPGESGNPSGRPKGSKSLQSLLWQAVQRKIVNPVDGRRYSVIEVIFARLGSEAARGNIAAIRLLVSYLTFTEESVMAITPGRLPAKAQDLKAIRDLLLAQLVQTDSKANEN